MKTTLLLLSILICSLVNGQEYTDKAWFSMQKSEIYTYTDADKDRALIKVTSKNDSQYDTITFITIESLFDSWDEYSKECYADSSYQIMHGLFYYTVGKSDVFTVQHIYSNIPKQPTLEGFMEYLRKKY